MLTCHLIFSTTYASQGSSKVHVKGMPIMDFVSGRVLCLQPTLY